MIKIDNLIFCQAVNDKDISVVGNGKFVILTPAQFLEMYLRYAEENTLKEI